MRISDWSSDVCSSDLATTSRRCPSKADTRDERSFAMAIEKEHREFQAIDLTAGWESPPGYPPGIEQKILAGALDEGAKRGNRTRLLRFRPGAFTTEPFVHDYWAEVYLVSGDLNVGNDADGTGGEKLSADPYACRPPPPAPRP